MGGKGIDTHGDRAGVVRIAWWDVADGYSSVAIIVDAGGIEYAHAIHTHLAVIAATIIKTFVALVRDAVGVRILGTSSCQVALIWCAVVVAVVRC